MGSKRILFSLFLIVPASVMSQTLPENLVFDEKNHLLILEGQDNSPFYDEARLESVYLEFTQPDFWQLLHDSHDTENYVVGTLSYDGILYDSIGARFKGQTSYKKIKDKEKLSFAISLDEYVDGQDIEGYNNLNFNNAFMDPTFMKEVVYNKLNRRNIPGARANFIKLYINGEYWGVYDDVQQLNKDFTKEWFLTNNGSLWRADRPDPEATAKSTEEGQPGDGPNWGDGTAALNYLGDTLSKYQEYYTLKSSGQEDPWELLLRLTDVLNNTPIEDLKDSVSPILNIDRTLWFLAHETIFADDDSYIHKGKMDYYIYFEPETNQFIPLEFDGNSALALRNVEWEAFYNEEKVNYPLMNRLYAIPELRQRYLSHVRSIIKELLDPQLTGALIDEYDALIRQAVESDPKKLTTFERYNRGLRQLKNFFVQRKRFLESNPEVSQSGLSIDFVKQAFNEEDFASPARGEPVDIKAKVSGDKGVGQVNLYYCAGLTGEFDKAEMFDDGAHADGLAGDGEYGASIPGFPGGEYVRYYVEAIADDAARTAVYSPEGAEHDVYFYRVELATVYSDIVINEVLASNTAIASDEEGEFDDWIELYNNSEKSISLSGYYLSDNQLDLKKWALPDISIEALSYLIIWADNDEEQGENHAGFKLSADGEELFLITPDGLIADQLTFGKQQTDLSLSRYPNGTGEFKVLEPTFNAENGVALTSIDSESPQSLNELKVYPNPFRSSTTIQFSLEAYSRVSLSVYNALGQELAILVNEDLPMGKHSIQWAAKDEDGGKAVESGLYLIRMILQDEGGVSSQTKQILKVK